MSFILTGFSLFNYVITVAGIHNIFPFWWKKNVSDPYVWNSNRKRSCFIIGVFALSKCKNVSEFTYAQSLDVVEIWKKLMIYKKHLLLYGIISWASRDTSLHFSLVKVGIAPVGRTDQWYLLRCHACFSTRRFFSISQMKWQYTLAFV